ncbi:MAG: hypothetical protein KDB23_16745 [Planctomycetales bacterium]|nr:hypothetical protein [Planctomycetales bacterium]
MSSPDQVRVYSTPRRFDLSTVLVITTAYALGFAGLRGLRVPLQLVALVGGFVTVVGLSQAVLFGGKYPRAASILTGVVLQHLVILLFGGRLNLIEDIVGCVIGGSICGYFAGTLVGGVFLIIDRVRSQFFRQA